ncbi:MAG TPA: sigma-70 family RNA polymerase sigma factor [Firmicutes bacterium]|jgi:RNA polymerase sigma factor (sigma-70 family)|nr:sigma-70 family RNA polymerase sigma factor [Bacillota bacterium]
MNRADAEQIITELMKPLYGFALKRCVNIQDAEDLIQEICLKAFRALTLRDDIVDARKFVWTVARNTLANYYRGKQSGGIGVFIDDLSGLPASDDDVHEQIIRDETEARLHKEIAYLSKLQRKIVIASYYEHKKQQEIANELGIPLGTVKWHLFEAKKDLRKGMDTVRTASVLKFNPIRFSLMGLNGSVGTMGSTANFFRSALSQNIAYCVYRQPKTINEIADCLGVSPVYIESEAEFLEEYGYLIKKGNKYLANLLIDEPNEKAQEIAKIQEDMYSQAAKIFANELYDNLLNTGALKYEGLVCGQNDNFILWSLIPYIAALSGEKLMETNIYFDEVATIRPDGAKNIAYAIIDSENGPKHKYYDSVLQWCGPCWNSNDELTLWQIDSEWSGKRVDDNYGIVVQRDLLLLKRFLKNEPLSKDEYAYLIERGYLKTAGKAGKDTLQIVWIKDNKTKQNLLAIGDKAKEKYHDEFSGLKAPFVEAVMDNIPDHLKKMQAYGLQYIFYSDGWFLLYCLKELVGSGKLKLPAKEEKKSLTILIVMNY